MCNDLDRQLSLGVDTEIFVITSSIPISTFSEGISAQRLEGLRVAVMGGDVNNPPCPPADMSYIYLLGGCMDNESLPRTVSAGEIHCILRGREDLHKQQMSSGELIFN